MRTFVRGIIFGVLIGVNVFMGCTGAGLSAVAAMNFASASFVATLAFYR